jgi:putative transposase
MRAQTPAFRPGISEPTTLEIFSDKAHIERAEAVLPTRASALTEEKFVADPAAEALLPRQTLTFKFRLRDKHAAELNRQARAVNYVWNYLNETQKKAAQSRRKWLGYHDLARLTAGASKDLDIHAHTIQRVCCEYARRRDQFKKPWLRWRGCKSLGWVPFNTGHLTFNGEAFKFRGVIYQTMHLRKELKAGAKIGAGSFNADARGRWYLNVPVEFECADSAPLSRVGLDLGLHDLATLSTGEKIVAPRFYRASEEKLATAQRARKTKRVRAIHAKVANRRKDFLHKASASIAKEFGLIVIGDVSPKKLAQTSIAKSVLDAGWSNFRRMLSYKAIRHGGSAIEVSERYTSQVCSACGSMPPSRPKGIADLSKRNWVCDDCGTVHCRDTNAALNILRVGLDTLIGGASLWGTRRGSHVLQGVE